MAHSETNRLTSWGGLTSLPSRILEPSWRDEAIAILRSISGSETILPIGMTRSYGDSCLLDAGIALKTRGLDRLGSFDRDRGIVHCDAGMTLEQLSNAVLPSGWFPPVVPGTKKITIGGAIANDIHGKNHHREGSFGRHVKSLELIRPDGIQHCSREENAELFRATIGGLGLTGLISSAEIALKRVESSFIETNHIEFRGGNAFLKESRRSDKKYEYTVGWIDWMPRSRLFGRGFLLRGNHAGRDRAEGGAGAEGIKHSQSRGSSIPFAPPLSLLRDWNISLHNFHHYHAMKRRLGKRIEHLDPFFFPLDSLDHWSRLYGKSGFFQYQAVYPEACEDEAMAELEARIEAQTERPFLTILKRFGSAPSEGLLSFPREGLTVCLDFPNRGRSTLAMLSGLDEITLRHGGALYPAKDARMPPELFAASFPHWREFIPHIAPGFTSNFWRRTGDRLRKKI